MTQTHKVVLSWSSGKDSAWALHVLRQRPDTEVVGLLTTVNAEFDRVAMHAVRRELLRAQAEVAELGLIEVELPWPCSNEAYEVRMRGALEACAARGADAVAFGDLFLEDVRRYREERMRGTGLGVLFPLWGLDTRALSREMVSAGMRAIVTCVDPKQVDASIAGREYDDALLDVLPAWVDPCGERGEFHSFVHAGPMFEHALPVRCGEVVERDGFVFADVVRAGAGAPALA